MNNVWNDIWFIINKFLSLMFSRLFNKKLKFSCTELNYIFIPKLYFYTQENTVM